MFNKIKEMIVEINRRAKIKGNEIFILTFLLCYVREQKMAGVKKAN